MTAENIQLQHVSDKVSIYTSKEHSFGTDAVILASFTANIIGNKAKRICDLGCGCGIIPLLLAERVKADFIAGVDVSPLAIEQFHKSVEKSFVDPELSPILADLTQLDKIPEHGSFDVVTSNPPYMKVSDGKHSDLGPRAVARHEILCDIFDVCKTASKLLNSSGRLFICHRPQRLPDVLEAMRQFKIEPKTLQMVTDKAGQSPWLFVVEGRKSVGAQLNILPELNLRDENGYSSEYKQLYRKDD